jgi:hypothetical protein
VGKGGESEREREEQAVKRENWIFGEFLSSHQCLIRAVKAMHDTQVQAQQ